MQKSIKSAAGNLPGKLQVRIQPPMYFLFLCRYAMLQR